MLLSLTLCSALGLVAWEGEYPVVAWAPESGLVLHAIFVLSREHRRTLPLLVVLGCAAGYVAAGCRPIDVAALTLFTVVSAAVAALAFARMSPDPARNPSRLSRFLAAAVVGSSAATLLEAAYLPVFHDVSVMADTPVLWIHFTGRLMGMALFALPILLSRTPSIWESDSPRALRWHRRELVAQPVVLAVTCLAIFSASPFPLSFVPLVMMVWAAVRLPVLWVVLELAVMTLVVTLFTMAGRGPFGQGLALAVKAVDVNGLHLARAELVQGFNLTIVAVTTILTLFVVTTRTQARAIADSVARQRDMIDASLVGLMILGRRRLPDGTLHSYTEVVEANASARQLFGLTGGSPSAMVLLDRLSHDDATQAQWAVRDVFAGRSQRVCVEFWLQSAACDSRRISATLSQLPNASGEVEQLCVQLIDVTDEHARKNELTKLALHDPLTGLGNRTLLEDRLDYWHDINEREGSRSLVVYVDLDYFKEINDTYGHEAGDEVLVAMADRMVRTVRPQDTVVRLGGDEFVVLVPQLPDDDEQFCDTFISRLGEVLTEPVSTAGARIEVGASMGVALSDTHTAKESLLRRADKSMYATKAARKRPVTSFTSAPLPQATSTPEELRTALEQDQFELYIQPLVDLPTGFILGGEALVRWNHPTRGLLSPDSWLGDAEGTGLIRDLGSWVISESCDLAAHWRNRLGSDSPVMHANISARQLGHGTLIHDVREALQRTGLPPDKLVIELTETQLDRSESAVNREIAELRDAGIQLAADDFGTGYSSLTRLTDMPIDIVKIDRTFVDRMGHDERAHAIVAALLTMGSELGLEVVAEGVETSGQAIDLRNLGCSVAQGYLWSRPVPAGVFLDMVATQADTTVAGAVRVM